MVCQVVHPSDTSFGVSDLSSTVPVHTLRGHLLKVLRRTCGGTGYTQVVSAARWEWHILTIAIFFFKYQNIDVYQ